jgi:uncharacterized protein DUF5989
LDCPRTTRTRAWFDGEAVLGARAVSFLFELWEFMRARRKFWLLPIFIVTLICGGLIVLTKGSAVAPFIYTLF